jgi:hypothetical protein
MGFVSFYRCLIFLINCGFEEYGQMKITPYGLIPYLANIRASEKCIKYVVTFYRLFILGGILNTIP